MNTTYTERVLILSEVVNTLPDSVEKSQFIKAIGALRLKSGVMEIIGLPSHSNHRFSSPGAMTGPTLEKFATKEGFHNAYMRLKDSIVDLIRVNYQLDITNDIGDALSGRKQANQITELVANAINRHVSNSVSSVSLRSSKK